jgi:hypothetical protein
MNVILMADDDADDQLLARDALAESHLDEELRFVENGEELLDYLLHQGKYAAPVTAPRPGLILLDIGVLACFEALRIFNLTDELPIGHLLVGVIGITLGTQCIFTGFVLISIKSITTRLTRPGGNRN